MSLKQSIVLGVSIVSLLCGCAGWASAATLKWTRNTDDTNDYRVWACFTPSCVLVKSPSTLQPGTVPQPAVGVVPEYIIDLAGKEGAIAVSARDLSFNESGFSVAVNFDLRAPAVPTGPVLTP